MSEAELVLQKSEFKNLIIDICHKSRAMGQDYVRVDPIINQKIDELFNYYVKDQFKVVDFLNEVEEQDWELDADDIKHILKLDFEYIRKQYEDSKQQKLTEVAEQ